jgi:hypothetical protein
LLVWIIISDIFLSAKHEFVVQIWLSRHNWTSANERCMCVAYACVYEKDRGDIKNLSRCEETHLRSALVSEGGVKAWPWIHLPEFLWFSLPAILRYHLKKYDLQSAQSILCTVVLFLFFFTYLNNVLQSLLSKKKFKCHRERVRGTFSAMERRDRRPEYSTALTYKLNCDCL